MRVLMVAWGSRGDVQPYVALGRGLAAAGHTVTIAAARDFEARVTGAGLGFAPFAISLTEDIEDPVVRRWLAGSAGPRQVGFKIGQENPASHSVGGDPSGLQT